MSVDVDPRLVALAEDYVRDLVSEVGRAAIAERRQECIKRLARAMQQACEDEYRALVEEVTA